MLRLCVVLGITGLVLCEPLAMSDPAPAQPQVVPAPVMLRDVTSYRYVDPPGIIVAPVDPRVLDKCIHGTMKVPVTWPPQAPAQGLDCKGLHFRDPIEIARPSPPFPSSPPTLMLPHWQKP